MTDNDEVKGQRSRSELEREEHEHRQAARFEAASEVGNYGLQGAVYTVLINGAILFGTLNLIKDYKDMPLVMRIGEDLSLLIMSAGLSVIAYYSFATYKIYSILLKIYIKGHEHHTARLIIWNFSYFIGYFSLIAAIGFLAIAMISIYHRVSSL